MAHDKEKDLDHKDPELQQEEAPHHSSGIISDWLQEKQRELAILSEARSIKEKERVLNSMIAAASSNHHDHDHHHHHHHSSLKAGEEEEVPKDGSNSPPAIISSRSSSSSFISRQGSSFSHSKTSMSIAFSLNFNGSEGDEMGLEEGKFHQNIIPIETIPNPPSSAESPAALKSKSPLPPPNVQGRRSRAKIFKESELKTPSMSLDLTGRKEAIEDIQSDRKKKKKKKSEKKKKSASSSSSPAEIFGEEKKKTEENGEISQIAPSDPAQKKAQNDELVAKVAEKEEEEEFQIPIEDEAEISSRMGQVVKEMAQEGVEKNKYMLMENKGSTANIYGPLPYFNRKH